MANRVAGKIEGLMKNILYILLLALFLPATAHTAPQIAFSDLINGPKSGLGDSLGQGAIVTIWGFGFGSTQGTSKVYFKDSLGVSREAAYVYYWKAADGTAPGGPALLNTYFDMYEIAFSIPSASADGAGKIYVEVGGVNSNEVDFYARSTGRFWFFSLSGDNANSGTYSSPKAAVNRCTMGTEATAAGDVIYTLGTYTIAIPIAYPGTGGDIINGSTNSHIALAPYPGTTLKCTSVTNTKSDFLVISKVETENNHPGITGSHEGRIVGCNVHGNGSAFPDAAGMIDGSAEWYLISGADTISNLKVFGNYIHDSGAPTDNKSHVTYFRLRDNVDTLTAPEIAYNYLKNNDVRYGIHYYDEQSDADGDPCVGDFVGTLSIHHNVIENQEGQGINVACTDGAAQPTESIQCSFPTDIYNNLLINCGKHNYYGDLYGINLNGPLYTGHVRIINNTIYGYGDAVAGGVAIRVRGGTSVTAFGGTWEFQNNIVVDLLDLAFSATGDEWKSPTVMRKNIYYSADGRTPPTDDTDPITTNPNLVGGSPFDYRLSASSTNAIGAGYDVSALVVDDIRGMSRGTPLDIGAFEYAEGEGAAQATRSMGAKPGLLP